MMPQALPGMMPMGNPMLAMMQMMQMMMGGGAVARDRPRRGALRHGCRPARRGHGPRRRHHPPGDCSKDLIKTQEAVPLGLGARPALPRPRTARTRSAACPRAAPCAFAGPPGKGKTRTALAALARVARAGTKVAFVVAEEGFHDEDGLGPRRPLLAAREDRHGRDGPRRGRTSPRRCSRTSTCCESQYHKGQSWDDFIAKYRYLVEKEGIGFVVIDSLNMLDPTKNRTADNLSALKTYNHEQGVTCLCIGQIRDTGLPVGGEALAAHRRRGLPDRGDDRSARRRWPTSGAASTATRSTSSGRSRA